MTPAISLTFRFSGGAERRPLQPVVMWRLNNPRLLHDEAPVGFTTGYPGGQP